MRREQDAPVPVGAGPKELRLVHPEFVLVEAENQHVTSVRIYLTPREHQEVVVPGKLTYLFVRPERVMVSQADTVQSRSP